MLVHKLLENSACKNPAKQAVWYNRNWQTYGELESNSNQLGNYLKESGIKRGDRVALLFENSFNYIAAYFGVLKAGGIVVSLNTDLKEDSLIYQLKDSGARCIMSQQKFSRFLIPALPRVPELRLAVIDQPDITTYQEIGHLECCSLNDVYAQTDTTSPSVRSISVDLAAIVYTSGSTGKPKGVMLSHLNLVANMHSIAGYLKLTPDDRIMVILPFFYIYGKSLLLTHILVGGSVVIDNRFLYPNVVLDTMREQEATGFSGVPSTFMILLNRSKLRETDFPALRYVTQAGGAMAPSVQKQVVEAFSPAKLYIMYGATEAAPRLSYLEPDMLQKKWGSIGKAIPDVDLYVADENGNPLPQGQTGELVARGANLFRGYWKDREGTEKVLRQDVYFTGDLGKMDEDGYLYVVGRSKDIIKVKGYRVSAKEVEETLLEINAISEVAAIGVPDQVLGEAIKVFVVLREGISLDETEILQFGKKKLPVYKQPKYVEFLPGLPKNKAGKVMKPQLREREKITSH